MTTRTAKDQRNRYLLLAAAAGFIGSDASPLDEADDDVGCADSVSKVILSAFPGSIRGSVSTAELYRQLSESRAFSRTVDIRPGDVIISPTGMSKVKNGTIKNGHVGIVGESEEIMSNNSSTGLWDVHYTIRTWGERYRSQGGYPLIFFRKL